MNITAFSIQTDGDFPENESESEEFEFVVGGKSYKTSIAFAEKISPKVKEIRLKDPSIKTFTVDVRDKRSMFSVLMNLMRTRQTILSKANSPIFIEFGKALGNKDLERSATIASSKEVDPDDFLDYIIDHKKKGINIVYDLQRVAEHFEQFYASKSFSKLDLEDIKTLSKLPELTPISKKLLKDIITKKMNLHKNIESFFIQKPKTSVITAHRDGDSFPGLIAALSKDVKGNPILTNYISVISKTELKNPEMLADPSKKGFVAADQFIQFDFEERRVKLDGYSIRAGPKTENGEVPAKYVLLASNNLLEWHCIDESVELAESFIYPFGECYRSVYCDEEYRFFRIIIIENFSRNKEKKRLMQLSAVEFYGEMRSI